GVGGDQHRGRRALLDQRGQHVDVRRDEEVVHILGLGDVDLGGTGRLELVDQTGRGAGGAHHDGGGLTQHVGGGDQFGGDLLEGTFGVLNEHKYFSHGFLASLL